MTKTAVTEFELTEGLTNLAKMQSNSQWNNFFLRGRGNGAWAREEVGGEIMATYHNHKWGIFIKNWSVVIVYIYNKFH